ncbi:MAG: LPS-assembly protein LptD [Nitratireductor sp.]|nr:LPS-assembly protein LptD [Nitratireductor sp.]
MTLLRTKGVQRPSMISGGLDGGRETRAADATTLSPVRRVRSLLLASIAVLPLAAVLCAALPAGSANAQVSGDTLFGEGQTDPNAQMLLEADELVYDQANNSVAAVGNVQIAYDGYTLVAERVTYNRNSGRVLASGAVEIVEPSGNRIFAEEIDITDNFQDGFVSALRVETPENTRFLAESAERRDGEIAVFNNGVYTACEPCKEDPSKPPAWQIRAKRVIVNTQTKTVEYENASFELFGRPIAYVEYFSHADPTIKRKSGFVEPDVGFDDKTGFRAGLSYFWALAPSYDLTLGGKYYANQGFLGHAEWRQRTELGEYSIRFAGIDQQDPAAFKDTKLPAGSLIDENNTTRYAVMTTGKFHINPRWKFGWSALYQSDGNFARTYDQRGFSNREITNEIYLTGLNGKNYFDLRAQKFLIQDNTEDQLDINDPTRVDPSLTPGKHDLRQDQQAKALPVWDYNVVSEDNIAGGQVSIDMNLTHVKRSQVDIANYRNPDSVIATPSLLPMERHHGVAGDYTRGSIETEWKSSAITGGAVVTASLSARGDAIFTDTTNVNTEYNPLRENKSLLRGMPAAMLEIRYPLIANDGMTSQIFEPIAQIIARPNETHIGEFPNEDAQSFVFDTTNLFERDKFSGYDRVEGGTRANVGFRYSASFANGSSLNVAAGQSYHLAGKNSFAQRDLVNAGLDSGLESDVSDYVASVDLNTGDGLTLGASGRFDKDNAEVNRAVAGARFVNENLTFTGNYVFINEQPRYGASEDRHELRGAASVKLDDRWRVFGSANYDIVNDQLYSYGIGLAYDDSCTSFSVAFQQSDDRYTGATNERSVMFRLGLRTLGETDYKYKLEEVQ